MKIPESWSELSWQQLCDVWSAKIRYGGNADVARSAALLALLQTRPTPPCEGEGEYHIERLAPDAATGEDRYLCTPMNTGMDVGWVFTPRELSQLAKQALPWFDYPYGDPGDPAVKDEKGKVIKEARDPHRGYVGPMRDALGLTETEVMVGGICFALPQVACNNLTWQQYRSLQAVAPHLFEDGITDEQALDLQAQFLAHCLVPEAVASGSRYGAAAQHQTGRDHFAPKHTFHYNVERAEQTVQFWRLQLAAAPTLFHICFQCYQTALTYYAATYPLLFGGDKKNDTMRDALQGEVGTVNTVMKYAGYAEQQQVYDSNLPFVLDILNTMTKEAKEIEKMNARIKKK